MVNSFVSRSLPLFVSFIFLSCLVYFPSLDGGFIVDDWAYILQNPNITNGKSPWYFWSTLHQEDYWPLSYSVFWLIYRIFGENVVVFHLCNVLLHALNSFLVYGLAKSTKLKWPILAALLFLVHPLNVQAVSWIFQLKTLLSTALALSSLLLLIEYKRLKTKPVYVGSLLFHTLAILAKASVVPMPLVMTAWFCGDKATPSKRIILLPYFFVSFVLGSLTLWVNALNFPSETILPTGLFERLGFIFRNFWFYIEKFFLPYPLSFVYLPAQSSLSSLAPYLGVFCFIFGIYACWQQRLSDDRSRFLLGYMLFIFPVVGFFFIPGMRLSVVYDHWAYLANAFAVVAFCLFIDRFSVNNRQKIAALIVIFGLIGVSNNHAKSFSSDKMLWMNVKENLPESAIAFYNLGTIFDREQRYDEAKEQYEIATEKEPAHARAWYNLGVSNIRKGDFAAAKSDFEKSIAVDPKIIYSHKNLALIYKHENNFLKAIATLKDGLNENPGNLELQETLTVIEKEWTLKKSK